MSNEFKIGEYVLNKNNDVCVIKDMCHYYDKLVFLTFNCDTYGTEKYDDLTKLDVQPKFKFNDLVKIKGEISVSEDDYKVISITFDKIRKIFWYYVKSINNGKIGYDMLESRLIDATEHVFKEGEYVLVSNDHGGDYVGVIIKKIFLQSTKSIRYTIQNCGTSQLEYQYNLKKLKKQPKFKINDNVRYTDKPYEISSIYDILYNNSIEEFSYKLQSNGSYTGPYKYYVPEHKLLSAKSEKENSTPPKDLFHVGSFAINFVGNVFLIQSISDTAPYSYDIFNCTELNYHKIDHYKINDLKLTPIDDPKFQIGNSVKKGNSNKIYRIRRIFYSSISKVFAYQCVSYDNNSDWCWLDENQIVEAKPEEISKPNKEPEKMYDTLNNKSKLTQFEILEYNLGDKVTLLAGNVPGVIAHKYKTKQISGVDISYSYIVDFGDYSLSKKAKELIPQKRYIIITHLSDGTVQAAKFPVVHDSMEKATREQERLTKMYSNRYRFEIIELKG